MFDQEEQQRLAHCAVTTSGSQRTVSFVLLQAFGESVTLDLGDLPCNLPTALPVVQNLDDYNEKIGFASEDEICGVALLPAIYCRTWTVAREEEGESWCEE